MLLLPYDKGQELSVLNLSVKIKIKPIFRISEIAEKAATQREHISSNTKDTEYQQPSVAGRHECGQAV